MCERLKWNWNKTVLFQFHFSFILHVRPALTYGCSRIDGYLAIISQMIALPIGWSLRGHCGWPAVVMWRIDARRIIRCSCVTSSLRWLSYWESCSSWRDRRIFTRQDNFIGCMHELRSVDSREDLTFWLLAWMPVLPLNSMYWAPWVGQKVKDIYTFIVHADCRSVKPCCLGRSARLIDACSQSVYCAFF